MTIVATPVRDPAPDLPDASSGGLSERAMRIQADLDFQLLTVRRARLGAVVVVPAVVVYFGYIVVLIAAPHLMHMRVGQNITAGFPLGLGVMIVTFLLVVFYVWRSSVDLDGLSAGIAAKYVP